ncbi:MAG TPA: response regulator transcription factor [Candidatus Acidoferrum sp.]|nr:response regulator transcription factor [Candidatus Acidoferrum sp.]
MSATILIVDDHDVVRQGVRSILAERPEWEICGEASTGEEAVHAAATFSPAVVILDISMPGMSGLEAASRIVGLGTGARILIFTMHESPRLAADVREAGAHGYVQKSQAARDLILAVERLLSGSTFFGSELDAQSEGTKAAKATPNSGISLYSAFCFR